MDRYFIGKQVLDHETVKAISAIVAESPQDGEIFSKYQMILGVLALHDALELDMLSGKD